MGTWFEASRDGSCGRCRKPVAKGSQLYARRKGVYLCELCGSIAEHEPEPDAGPIEQGVLRDLRQFPAEAAGTVIAQALLSFARQLDEGDVSSRDQPSYLKEIRQGLLQLRLAWPAAPEADETEAVRSRRERRLMQTGDSDAPEF